MELKRLMDYRIQYADTEEQKEKERGFYGIGLTSRKNLCIHPEVSHATPRFVLDGASPRPNVSVSGTNNTGMSIGVQGEERQGCRR